MYSRSLVSARNAQASSNHFNSRPEAAVKPLLAIGVAILARAESLGCGARPVPYCGGASTIASASFAQSVEPQLFRCARAQGWPRPLDSSAIVPPACRREHFARGHIGVGPHDRTTQLAGGINAARRQDMARQGSVSPSQSLD